MKNFGEINPWGRDSVSDTAISAVGRKITVPTEWMQAVVDYDILPMLWNTVLTMTARCSVGIRSCMESFNDKG